MTSSYLLNKQQELPFASSLNKVNPATSPQLPFHDNHADVIKLSHPIPAKPTQSDFLTDLIHPRSSFQHLHISEFNSVVYNAAQEVIHSKSPVYNPLFITSESAGIGKTHFAQAIALAFRETPEKNICYAPAESFTQEFVTAIRTDSAESFKYKYRKQLDVLIMDDVHLLAKRFKTQLELIFIYEELLNAGKKIIFTSCLPPHKLAGFDPRLVSRFGSGLIASINNPGVSELEKIISKKALSLNLPLRPEMARFIALNSEANIAAVEGNLVRLLAKCSLEGRKLTMELVADIIAEISVRDATRPDIKSIELIVCRNFGVVPEQLKSRSRKQQIAEIRMIVMHLTRKHTELSLGEIGSYYNKNHNTVIHACDTVESRNRSTPIFRLQLEHIEKQLKDLMMKGKDVTI